MPALSQASSFRDLVAFIIGYINLILPVLAGFAIVFFLWGAVRYVMAASDAKGKGPAREALLWGIIALFVLFSLWGILRVISLTFLGTDTPTRSAGAPIDLRP